MSQSNIYDTFLSIRITADSRSRLEEIRELTETILRNRDDINKMADELKGILTIKAEFSPQKVAEVYKMGGIGEVPEALKKFAEPFTEESFEKTRESKKEELADIWDVREYNVAEKLADIGNILRARLVETITDPTEETTEEMKEIIERLNILTEDDLKVGEINKILEYVTNINEQTFQFSKILGSLTSAIDESFFGTTGMSYDIKSQYKYDPSKVRREELTSMERGWVTRYTKSKEKGGMEGLDESDLEELRDIAESFGETDEVYYTRVFISKMKEILQGKKISIDNILDPQVATTFYDEIMNSDMFSDAYKKVLTMMVEKSASELHLNIYDNEQFKSFIEELKEGMSDEHSKRFMEDWAKGKMKEFERDPQLESIQTTIPLLPPSKFKPHTMEEAMDVPEFAGAFAAAPIRGIEMVADILENNYHIISVAEDNIKLIAQELEKLPDKTDLGDIQRGIEKIGRDLRDLKRERDNSIRSDIF